MWVASGLTAVLATGQAATQGERVVARPADTGELFANPGMGWVLHFYDNVPTNYGSQLDHSDTVDDFPALGVVYLRIPWSYVEPEEGRFEWSVVDTPAQRWIRKGVQIAFRFSCSESWMRWATPEWVQKAGAKGHNFAPGKGVDEAGPFWEPDYDDPIFLEKLDHFLAAAAARYDGDPHVAWVDVGSFGVWGEGHTYHSSGLGYSAETLIRHIDLHLKHFRGTLLAANDDFVLQGRGDGAIDYARERGLTLRDDSILVQPAPNAFFHAEMAQGFWPNHPVVLESEHYGGSRDRGNWQDGSEYLRALEEYHASYPSIHWWPREFLNEQRALIEKMSLRMGYRLQLVEAAWPTRMRLDERLTFTAEWRNAGVAPCYPGGHPTVVLKDAQGGIAGVFVDDTFNLRELPVGPPGQAESRQRERAFDLPFNLRPGEYDLFIAVTTPIGTPHIRLPLADGDGELRYRLGRLAITGHYGVQVGAPEARGAALFVPATWTLHEPLPPGTQPFCHLERDGQIAFFGKPEVADPGALFRQVGEVSMGFLIEPPPDARGSSFEMKLGLWVPERVGRADERLIPDRGAGDRRVTVGALAVAEDGITTLTQNGGD